MRQRLQGIVGRRLCQVAMEQFREESVLLLQGERSYALEDRLHVSLSTGSGRPE